MLCAALMFIVICAVVLLCCFGMDGAAFRIMSSSQDWFQPDEVELRTVGRRDASATKRHVRNVTPLTKKRVAAAGGWKCKCGCGRPLTYDFHIDHIRPLWQGGDNSESNLRALNPGCHLHITSLQNQI